MSSRFGPLAHIVIPAAHFEWLPKALRPRRAWANPDGLRLEYRARGKSIVACCDVVAGKLATAMPPEATPTHRTLTRGLTAYISQVPDDSLAAFASALAITKSGSPTSVLDESAGPLARFVRVASTGGDELFRQTDAILELLDEGRVPKRGLAVARTLADLGFGGRAVRWMRNAEVQGAPARRACRRLAQTLRSRDPQLAGPPPLDGVERVLWIESLLGTERRAEAMAAAGDLIEQRPDLTSEILQAAAPWASELLGRLDPEQRAHASSRLALWRGDHAEAQRTFVDLGGPESEATRVGILHLSGKTEDALARSTAATNRWPEHQELALWHCECLLRLARIRDAQEFSEAHMRVLGSHPVVRLHRALQGFDSLGDSEVGAATHYFHRSILRELFPDEALEFGHEGTERGYLWRALKRLGGNRTPNPTVVVDGELQRVRIREPRTEVVRIQHQAVFQPVAEVQDALRRFDEELPGVPFGPTYSAELDLFTGAYASALEVFERSWQETRTRWSYVGSGAALVMLEQYEEALERFEEGERVSNGLIRGEATHAYRGEALLRLGRLEEALPHLEYAFEVEPRRVGGGLVLAQLYRALGRSDDQETTLKVSRALAPCLWYEATQSGGDALDNAVGMILGNRSSHMLTFFDRKGRWRVFPLWNTGPLASRLAAVFREPVYGDELWAAVEHGWTP